MGVYSQELDNMVKWEKSRAPFYEVYFIKLNWADFSRALWLRYTLLAPKRGLGTPSASVWGMYYDAKQPENNIAVKETISIEQTLIDRDIFYFQIQDSAIYNSGARGRVSSGGHEMQWDFQFPHNEETFRLYPTIFYYLPFPKTKLLSPNWSVEPKGELKLDKTTIPCPASRACQSHLWGTSHAERWAWAHCNTFVEDESAVFEALTAQVRVGKKLLRPLTVLALRWKGGPMLTFNRVVQWLTTKSDYNLDGWSLLAERGHWRVQIRIENQIQQMLGVTYTDTDGAKLYCYHAETAAVRVEIFSSRGGKWQSVKTLTSPLAGAYEIVERTPLPGMKVHL